MWRSIEIIKQQKRWWLHIPLLSLKYRGRLSLTLRVIGLAVAQSPSTPHWKSSLGSNIFLKHTYNVMSISSFHFNRYLYGFDMDKVSRILVSQRCKNFALIFQGSREKWKNVLLYPRSIIAERTPVAVGREFSGDQPWLAKENNMNGYLLLMQFEKLDMSSFIFFSQFPGAFREGRKIINMPGIKVGEK